MARMPILRFMAGLTILLGMMSQQPEGARADDHEKCVKASCEAKARSCFVAASETTESCLKSARQACDTVMPSEKANCLRGGLIPCARTRNASKASCLDTFKSCYATCGTSDPKKIDLWCTFQDTAAQKSGFCGGLTNSSVREAAAECARQLFPEGHPDSTDLTCETL